MSLPPIPTSLLRKGAIESAQRTGAILGREIRPGAVEFAQRAGVEKLEEESGVALPGGTESWATENDTPQYQWQQLKQGMQDDAAVRDEPNKFLSMIGTIAKPLAYIDIPTQLGSELLFDTAEAFLGKDSMDWIQGTDESRELFAGWKAIGKAMRGETGLIDASNEIAAAYEKKPLWSQFALGFAMGGVASSVSKAAKLGKLAKPLAYTLDPTLGAWHVIKPAVKYGMAEAGIDKAGRLRRKYGSAYAIDDPSQAEHVRKDYIDNTQEYRERSTIGVDENVDPHFVVPTGEMKPLHHQVNAVVRLKKLLMGGPDNDALATLPAEVRQSFGPTKEVQNLVMSRDLALLELQQLAAGRPGWVEQMKLRDLEHFLQSGEINLEQLTKTGRIRGVKLLPPDDSEKVTAMQAVGNYLNVLKTTQSAPDGMSLYEAMLKAGSDSKGRQIAEPFRVIGATYDAKSFLPSEWRIGSIDKINADNLIGSKADDSLMLTNRLRFYNRHIASQLTPEVYDDFVNRYGEGNFQIFPDVAQPLRAVGSTNLAARPGVTPADVIRLLGHAEASDDLYTTYIVDGEVIDIADDLEEVFGRAWVDDDGVLHQAGNGYFQDKVGIIPKAIRTKYDKKLDVIEISDTKKVQLAESFDFDEIADTYTRTRTLNTQRPLPDQKVDINILQEDLDYVAKSLGITRRVVAVAGKTGTKKGAKLMGQWGTMDFDQYAYAIANIRFHRILNAGQNATSGEDAFNPFWTDMISDLKNSKDMQLDGASLDDADNFLLEVAAFEKAQSEAIGLLRAEQRIEMRMKAVRTQLLHSGWLKKTGFNSYTLNTVNGKLAPDAKKYADWMRRRGIAGEIDFDKAWRLWGGVRKGDKTEYSGIRKQFQEKFGVADGDMRYDSLHPDYKMDYQSLAKITRKIDGQPTAATMMVAGMHEKQKELLTRFIELKARVGDNVPSNMKQLPESHPIFAREQIYDMLADATNITRELPDHSLQGMWSNPEWTSAIKMISGEGKVRGVNIQARINRALKPLRTALSASDELVGIETIDVSKDLGADAARAQVRRWLGIELPEKIIDRNTGKAFNPDDEVTPAKYSKKGKLLKKAVTVEDVQKAMLEEQQKAKTHIKSILNTAGVKRNMTHKELREALTRAYKTHDQSFGMDIAGLDAENPKVVARLNRISEIFSSDTDLDSLLKDANMPMVAPKDVGMSPDANEVWENHQKWLKNRRDLQVNIQGVSIPSLGGRVVNPASTNGYIPDIHKLNDMITNPKSEFGKRWRGLNPDGSPSATQNRVQKFYGALAASAAGGAAARGVSQAAKFFLARRKAWAFIEDTERAVVRDVSIMLNDTAFDADSLGFYTETATNYMRQIQGGDATATGNQFFGNIRTKRVRLNANEGEVLGWEDDSYMSPAAKKMMQDALDVINDNKVNNYDFMIKSADEPKFNQWKDGERAGDTADDIAKLSTQVDVVLGYVPVHMWDEIYEMSDAQKGQLGYLQGITAQADNAAEARGYDIQAHIDSENAALEAQADWKKFGSNSGIKRKKAEYMRKGAGYIPLLRKQHASQLAKNVNSKDAIQNNFAWWVRGRQDNNIFYVLGEAKRNQGNVMESLEIRLGKYVGTMHKHVVDLDTQKALKALSKPAMEGGKSKTKMLGALRAVVNARQAGRLIFNETEAEQWDILKRSDYESWFDGTPIMSHVKELQLSSKQYAIRYAQDNAAQIELDIKESMEAIEEFKEVKEIFPIDIQKSAHQNQVWQDGVFLNEQDRNMIREQMIASDEHILGGVTTVAEFLQPLARLMRTFKAGFDVGVMFIHGYNSLMSLPVDFQTKRIDFSRQKAWGKAFYNMTRMVANPDYYDTYMAQTRVAELRSQIKEYVVLGHSEPLAALQDSNTFTRWRSQLSAGQLGPLRSDTIKELSRKGRLSHRMEAGFVGGIDTLRLNLWETMYDTVRRDYEKAAETARLTDPETSMSEWGAWTENPQHAGKKQREAMTDLGAVINKMTGVYDRDLAGLTPTQNVIENSLLFFAPAYRRATGGVIMDLLHDVRGERVTRIRNREAARQISGIVTSGIIVASLAEHVLGQEGAADVTSGNFGKIELNGVKMGFGSAWYTAWRLAGDIYKAASVDPDGDIKDYLKDNPIITMLGRRSRSQLAPPASLAMTLWTGKSYMGDPMRDDDGSNDWSGMLDHSLKAMTMPFWMDNFAENGYDGGSGPVAGLAEVFGLQAWRVSEFDKVLKARKLAVATTEGYQPLDTWKAENPDGQFTDMPILLRQHLEENHAGLKGAMDEYQTHNSAFARGTDGLWVQWHAERGAIDKVAMSDAAKFALQFEKGLISGKQFKDAISSVKTTRWKQTSTLMQNKRYEPVYEKISENRDRKDSLDTAYFGDVMYVAYQEFLDENSKLFVDDNGIFNHTKYEQAVNQFRTDNNLTVNSHIWRYILDRKNKWFSDPVTGNKLVMDLEHSKDILKPYWRIHEGFDTNDQLKARKWMSAANDRQRKIMMAADPSLARIAKKIEAARKAYRIANPEVDWYLVKYHNAAPVTRAAIEKEAAWRNQQRFASTTNIVQTLSFDKFDVSPAGKVFHRDKQKLSL